MKYIKSIILFFFASLSSVIAFAQGTEYALGAAMFSYFTAGFALLFIAVFAFSFIIKTIVQQKAPQRTTKQIVYSSLRLAFIIAVVLILGIYLFLTN